MKRKAVSIKKSKFSVLSGVILAVLILYTLILALLILWAIMVSLQTTDQDVFDLAGQAYYKMPIHFELHYVEVFQKLSMPGLIGEERQNFLDILGNSLLYSILSAFLKTLVPCLTAYACARYKFKTSTVVYTAVLMAMVIPVVGSLPSELNLAYAFKVGDFDLIIDNVIGTSLLKANMLGLYFFVMYSAFESMPNDFFEAAKIDGANNWYVLFKIGLPLIKNVFLTVFIINFVTFWNDYQTPMVYLNHRPTLGFAMWKLTFGNIGDAALSNSVYAMTTVILSALPVVILFIIFKDKFMGNLTMGGIKG